MSEYVVPTTASDAVTGDLGVNAWLVEENYQEYLANPSSVDESWRAYFAGGQQQPAAPSSVTAYTSNGSASPTNGAQASVASPPSIASPAAPASPSSPAAPAAPVPSTVPAAAPDGETATPLRGAAARIVENMVASLAVPTATSVHPVPAKIIEVNRTLINEYLAGTTGKKVSFTHIIAYAVVKAVGLVPSMNSTFVEDVDGNSTPGVIRHAHIGLGIAIDIERSSGRSLLVPAVKNADSYDFAGFVAAYEDLIAKARTNKLSVEDFSGVTLTITNPGTLGTTQSVPRLMRGQGTIVGVGALDFPVEYRATDPKALAALGVGKVVTLTSTYDHRIIQGAESGLFLKHVDEFLVGERGFYEEIFASLGMTELPAHLSRDTTSAIRPEQNEAGVEKQLAVTALIESYRVHGHRAAHLNPLAEAAVELPEDLDPAHFGLSVWDLDRRFFSGGLTGKDTATLREILEHLRRAYCGALTMEYKHVQDSGEQEWLRRAIEAPVAPPSQDEQRFVLNRLNDAEIFESFLHTRYVGQKRFGLEGGTSAIPFIDAVLDAGVKAGVREAVLGMSHRGRLNVLANVIGKPYSEIFGDFEGNLDLSSVQGTGDMKYHKGGSGIWTGADGSQLPVTLVPNPSHLEAVNPVVEGITRSKQDRQAAEQEPASVLAVLMHGDASFAGQGVVAETLNLSQLAAYAIGGTVHLVINNQIGFTTPPTSARSSAYATDIAKGIEAPILHVNGDEPEAVVRAARIAFAYRQAFAKDVVVDLVCYRTYGHNEGDDPSYTQPLMYRAIANHEPVSAAYAESLISQGVTTSQDVQSYIAQLNARLAGALEETRKIPVPHLDRLPDAPANVIEPLPKDTAIDRSTIVAVAEQLGRRPEQFTTHPKLARQTEQRDELFRKGDIDWALGEALAFGTVMLEGHNVRLIGQDAQRGTFSHRHAVLVDYETGDNYVPLSVLKQYGEGVNVGTFEVYDSLLSEYAALGFEYGYSVDDQNTLVLWEAQFGDFANGAQIIIDNFVVAAEEKWGQQSGLVMLLPHGYEGQGPEHSSARLERYLAAAANGNVTIAQPTTSAQYFHLLRAQARLSSRRPLIVMTPKFLLRARAARSRIDELVEGSFSEVLDDPSSSTLDPSSIGRIVCCSGKIAFEALDRRDARAAAGLGPQSAIVRIEQLYPWPEAELEAIINRYPNATELVWLQDEPANMGAWSFVYERLNNRFANRLSIRSVTRAAAGTPATGSHLLHDLEVAYLLDESVGTLPVVSA